MKVVERALGILVIGIYFTVVSSLCSGCSKSKGNLAFVGKPAVSGSTFVFTLTNTGSSTIVYLTGQPQIRSGSGWTDVPSNPQTNMAIMKLLPPRQSGKVTVATPPGGAPWRLAILWGKVPALTPWRRVELAAQRIFHERNRGLPVSYYTNFSAEITP